jgi:hypothetical protein
LKQNVSKRYPWLKLRCAACAQNDTFEERKGGGVTSVSILKGQPCRRGRIYKESLEKYNNKKG